MTTVSSDFSFSSYSTKNQSQLGSQVPEKLIINIANSTTNVSVNSYPFIFGGRLKNATHPPIFVTGGVPIVGSVAIERERYQRTDLYGYYQRPEIYVSLIDEFSIKVLDSQNYVLTQSSATVAIMIPFWS